MENNTSLFSAVAKIGQVAASSKINRHQCNLVSDLCSKIVVFENSRRHFWEVLYKIHYTISYCAEDDKWLWEAVIGLNNAVTFASLVSELYACILEAVSVVHHDVKELSCEMEKLVSFDLHGRSGLCRMKTELKACAKRDSEELHLLALKMEKQIDPADSTKFEMVDFLKRKLKGDKCIYPLSLDLSAPSSSVNFQGVMWGREVVALKVAEDTVFELGKSQMIGWCEKGKCIFMVMHLDYEQCVEDMKAKISYRLMEVFQAMEYHDCTKCHLLAEACCELTSLIHSMHEANIGFFEEVLSIVSKGLLLIEGCGTGESWLPTNELRSEELKITLIEMSSLVQHHSKSEVVSLEKLLAELLCVGDDNSVLSLY